MILKPGFRDADLRKEPNSENAESKEDSLFCLQCDGQEVPALGRKAAQLSAALVIGRRLQS